MKDTPTPPSEAEEKSFTKTQAVELLRILGDMAGNGFAEQLERVVAHGVFVVKEPLTQKHLRDFCAGGEVSILKIRDLIETVMQFIARCETE